MISVIIPVRNGADTLARCLQSIHKASIPPHEVIVVDDGSTDPTAEIASSHGCRVIRNDTTRGAAFSRNEGARHASGDLFFFTDADIEVPPSVFQTISSFFQQNVTAAQKDASAMIGILSKSTESPEFASKYENYYMHRHYFLHSDTISIFYTSAAAIRRDLFFRTGGFDEHYSGASIEDMEFGRRLTSAGVTIKVEKSLQVHHLKHFTVISLLKTNARKSEGTLKIKLRSKMNQTEAGHLVAPPKSFLAGIPLTGLLLVSICASLLTFSSPWLVLAAGCLTGIIGMNYAWLVFLYRNEGALFLLKSIGMMLLNYLAYGYGIVRGFISFKTGNRY